MAARARSRDVFLMRRDILFMCCCVLLVQLYYSVLSMLLRISLAASWRLYDDMLMLDVDIICLFD